MADPKGASTWTRLLDLRDLIAGPLVAVVDADVHAARAFQRFLLDAAFEPVGDGADGDELGSTEGGDAKAGALRADVEALLGAAPGNRRLGPLRTFTFSYRKRDSATGALRMHVVKVPVITLLPLPLLQVSRADFDFHVSVLGASDGDGGDPPIARAGGLTAERTARPGTDAVPSGDGAAAPRLLASVAPTSPTLGGRAGGTGGAPGGRASLDANMRVKVAMRQADMPGGLGALLNVLNGSVEALSTEVDPSGEPGDEPGGDTAAAGAG